MSFFINNVGFFHTNLFSSRYTTNSLYSNPLFTNKSRINSQSSRLFDIHNLTYGINNRKTAYVTGSAVKNYGNSLSAVLTRLATKGSNSLFNKIGASSSASAVASATVNNAKFDEKKNSPVNLNVAQIAKAQINSGAAVSASGRSVNSGNYEFAIDINGREQKFAVKVDFSDNNASIQKKMAAAINSKGIGVTASVTNGTGFNTTKLSLTADKTGNANTSPVFKVRDTRGNLAAKMGIDQISQNAQNAAYSVNGVAATSTSNQVDLGNGVTATLKTAGSTSLTFQRDGSGSIDAVKELVGTLNNILMNAANSRGRGSDRLGQAVSSMNKAYKGILNSAGINVSAGGMLSVNEDKLKQAAENGVLERLFQSNGSYGFAYRARRLGENMSESSMFANKISFNDNSYNYNSRGRNYYNYASKSYLFDSIF